MKAGGKRAHGRAAGRWQEDMHMHGWEGGRVAGVCATGRLGRRTCTWTQAPKLEKEASAPSIVVAPTSSLSGVVTGS